MEKKLQPLADKLGITFNDATLVDRAFVHRSYLNENKQFSESNERLEFLGDAIISFIVALYLYNKFPHANEGDLTNYRASLVSRKFLGGVGISLELGNYLYLAKGEEDAGGRNNATVLSNTFEALIGVVYLDLGIESATKIVEELVLSSIDEIISTKSYRDHKSALQEVVQSKFHKPPVYKVANEEGPEHAKTFTVTVTINDQVIGTGQGRSKQTAEQEAAKQALEKFES